MYSVENIGTTRRGIVSSRRPDNSQTVTYKDAIGNTKTSSNLRLGDTTTICAQQDSISKGPGIVCIELGPCVTQQPKPIPPVVVIKPIPPAPKPPRPIKPKPRPPKPPTPISTPIQIGTSGQSGGRGTGSGGGNNVDDFRDDDKPEMNGSYSAGGNGGEIVLRKPRTPREL